MSARARLYLDLALFGALFVAYNPVWTGLAVHEWLSVVARVNLVVDGALFVAAVTVMLSGLMVSQAVAGAFGVAIVPTALWATAHSISADAAIALLLVHFALHWKWIVNAARRLGRPTRFAREAADPRRSAWQPPAWRATRAPGR